MRWLWLTIAVIVAILIPFVLFEDYFNALAARAAGGELSTTTAVVVIGGLLALDVFLPVPSSLVSAAAGVLLGLVWGTVVVWVGMTVSCVIGYAVGARSSALARRLVGADGLARAADAATRYGLAALALCRPVPVLAEASVVMAGMMRVPPARFAVVCVWSNLGVAFVYAAIGAWSMGVNSFLLAFLGAMAFPGAAWLVARVWSARLGASADRARDDAAERH